MLPFHQLLNEPPPVPSSEATPVTQYPERTALSPRAPPYPHLTSDELAARWRMTTFALSGKYRKLGLRPVRVGKRLLFLLDQIEEVERRSMTR